MAMRNRKTANGKRKINTAEGLKQIQKTATSCKRIQQIPFGTVFTSTLEIRHSTFYIQAPFGRGTKKRAKEINLLCPYTFISSNL
jgi:hypothetical protein